MFLNLIVAKLEHLELIREGSLRSLRLSKVVAHFAVWEGLLDILIVEVDDCVAIRESLPLDPVVEDDFLLAVLVDALDFSILANVLLSHLLVW